jgi:Family of unknown function (DUF6510)
MSEGAWIDGNGAAGALEEAFGADMTTVVRICGSCGDASPLGAHRAFTGMGVVLRCPHCHDLALTVVALPDRYVVQVRGSMRLELPRR